MSPVHQVPVLPVVIPLGIAIFALLLLRLHVKGLLSAPRVTVATVLSVYAAGITANTVFPIFLNGPENSEPWIPGVALIPLTDYELHDALMNTAVFIPLGMLFPLFLPRSTWPKLLAVTVVSSLGIELTQLAAQAFLAGGHIADINDFLFNVLGGAIGYGLFRLATRAPWLSASIDRLHWFRTS